MRRLVGIVLCLGIAVVVFMFARGHGGPDYSPTASANCFRAENIAVTVGRQRPSGRFLILRRKGYEPLYLFFAKTSRAAQDWAARQHNEFGMPVDRNVVFDVGGSLSDMPPRLLACLRSG